MRAPSDGEPAVTVGMSVLDAERTVLRALRSLQAQTLRDWRLIVVDDGSRDGTAALIEHEASGDPRIELVRGGVRLGLPDRLNQIVGAATGRYFARMDADDVAYPDRLARQLEYLESNPRLDLVGAAMTVVKHSGQPIGWRPCPATHDEICARPHAGFPLFHPTWFGRTEWFRRNPYRSTAVRCEDQELLLRTHRVSRFGNVPEPLLGYAEDRLAWRGIATGRANFARAAIGDSRAEGARARMIAIAVEQGLKGAVDAVAIATRSERRLLRHRARPMDPGQAAAWESVRDALWRDRADARPTSSAAAG